MAANLFEKHVSALTMHLPGLYSTLLELPIKMIYSIYSDLEPSWQSSIFEYVWNEKSISSSLENGRIFDKTRHYFSKVS